MWTLADDVIIGPVEWDTKSKSVASRIHLEPSSATESI